MKQREEALVPSTSSPDYALVRSRLSQVRKRQGMSLRSVAEETGISAATLSRLEAGRGTPDLETLDKLADWMGLSRGDVYRTTPDDPLDTIAAIEVHLRADPRLDPRTAAALVDGFRTMYERFTEDEAQGPISRETP